MPSGSTTRGSSLRKYSVIVGDAGSGTEMPTNDDKTSAFSSSISNPATARACSTSTTSRSRRSDQPASLSTFSTEGRASILIASSSCDIDEQGTQHPSTCSTWQCDCSM